MAEPAPSTPTASRPRYSSLDDYLQVLRRRRWIVLVLTVLGIAAGVAIAVSSENTYTATASTSFRDISQDLTLFGIDAIPESSPAVRAAINAERVTRPEVTQRVAKEFEGELSGLQLIGAIEARVGAQTQLVVLEATAATPELAARIANAYALTTEKLGEEEIDKRLAGVERSLEGQLDKLDIKDIADQPGIGVRISTLEQQLSRVKTLRDITDPVEVTQEAVPPSSANNPAPVAAGMIGGLIGLLFGLVAAFTRDALDRRVRSSHDVHSELGFPIIGRVVESAMGYPGLADPRDRKPISESDFEAFRVLRTNLGFMTQDAPPARCVLIAGSKPEEGKTTVSMSLASAAAMAGSRVLLLEGDLRRPSFANRLGINPGPGIADYLRGQAEPSQVVQLVDLFPPLAGDGNAQPNRSTAVARLAVITAGTLGGDAAELLSSERFSHFIAEVREAYDLVVIDSSPLLAVVDPLQLVQRADAVLVCARAHSTTRDELRAARSALANLPTRPYGAVITGLRRDGPDAYSYYYGY